MADEFNKKILITAETKLGPVKAEILALNQTLDEQLTKQKLLELQGKRSTAAYVEIASQVRLTKQAIRESNRELDASVKSFQSATNSADQNRALVKSLTLEYNRLSQEEGKTAASTIKLGETIAVLNQKIREQGKAVGDNKATIGNYREEIVSALSGLTGSIPGMQQYAGAAQNIVKVVGFLPSAFTKAGNVMNEFVGNPGRNIITGFGSMQKSATSATAEVEKAAEGLATVAPAAGEAEAGLTAVGAGATIAGTAIVALTAIIGTAVYYVSTLGSVGLKSAQVFDGVKASLLALADDVAKGKMKNLGDDMKAAYNGAVELKKGMQELDRRKDQADVTVAQYDREIAANMLLLRNKNMGLEEAKRIDKETEKLENERVKLKQDNLKTEYQILIQSSINSKKVSDAERAQIEKQLQSGNLALIQNLEKNDKIMAGTSKQIKDIELNIVTAGQEGDLSEQKSKNRLAIIEGRFGKAGAKFAETRTKELAEANAAYRQAENDRMQSLARQYEFTLSAYGKELDATNAHYKNLIFSEAQFVAKMEKSAKLAKSPDAKKRFANAAAQGRLAIDQLDNEWDQALRSAIENNDKKIYELVVKSQNDLQQATIANIKDSVTHQVATLELQSKMRAEAVEQERFDRQTEIDQLRAQAAKAGTEEANSLSYRAAELQKIQDNANKKLIEETQATEDAIKAIKKKANEDLIAWQNEANVDSLSPSPGKLTSRAYYEAQKQQLNDQTDKEIGDATETPGANGLVKDTSGIRKKAADKRLAIDKNAALEKKQFELNITKQTADAAFNIAQNSIKQKEEATIASLERQKTTDLRNTALTVTQKQIIEDKYRVKEGQAKVKAFNQEKEASLAKAAILTALNILTATLNPFELALAISAGVAEIAVIAAQKPPAYATGAIHYNSDGTGSLLRGPGTGKSDSMNARLSNGEAVINATSTSMFAPLLSAINQAGGGRSFGTADNYRPWIVPTFATGGMYNGYTPSVENGLKPIVIQNNRMHSDDINAIVSGMAAAAMNVPAGYIDVKDISYAQSKRAFAEKRVNF